MRILILYVFMLYLVWPATAREQMIARRDSLLVTQDTFPSSIEVLALDKGYKFSPTIRPLVPIPGGRQAFYTYLWDFGDGQFSTEESPTHRYALPGEYEVSLYVVNNYDNGPRPKKPKTRVLVDSNSAIALHSPNPLNNSFLNPTAYFSFIKMPMRFREKTCPWS